MDAHSYWLQQPYFEREKNCPSYSVCQYCEDKAEYWDCGEPICEDCLARELSRDKFIDDSFKFRADDGSDVWLIETMDEPNEYKSRDEFVKKELNNIYEYFKREP